MERKTYRSDIISMALLYRKEYVNTDMLLLDKTIKFDQVINDNLNKLDTSCGIKIVGEEISYLYSLMSDENGKIYAVINQNIDLGKAWQWYVYALPTEVIMSSYMDNALKEIGLIEVNGKIVDRNTYYEELRKKYNLIKEFVKEPFDIFRDWKNIVEDSFIENYCISEAEKCILKELRENRRKSNQGQEFTKIYR